MHTRSPLNTCARPAHPLTTHHSPIHEKDDMVAYVQSTGPLSVCVDASEWGTYQSGVIAYCDQELNHCVQVRPSPIIPHIHTLIFTHITTRAPILIHIKLTYCTLPFYHTWPLRLRLRLRLCLPLPASAFVLQVVGTGTYDYGTYYIVKNSWGSAWGTQVGPCILPRAQLSPLGRVAERRESRRLSSSVWHRGPAAT